MRSLLNQPLYTDRTDGTALIAHRYRPTVTLPEVKKGTIVNWASVPNWLHKIAPQIKESLGKAATGWHDAAYESGGFDGKYTREECDRIMLGIMILDGCDPEMCWIAYNAVRVSGGDHWKEPKREVLR